MLADTRVQVFVNKEGLLFSPRLVNSDGRQPAQRAADQHALDLTRTIRFEPMSAATGSRIPTFVEATLVFEWHTIEPPALAPKP